VDQLIQYEAVQLFIARARQHQTGFLLTEQITAPVAEICRRMDGLPLAIELAAARLRTTPVKALAEAMREASGIDWLKLFHVSTRDFPQRQRTLFNTVAWSYSLLNADLQAMLRQLSVFSGSFDWAAVSTVVAVPALVGEASLREGFEQLVNHNLVSQVSASPERWRLLEMVREFSQSELAPVEANALRRRHAHHFLSRLTKAVKSSPVAAFLAACDMEVHNMRAALRFALEIADATLAHQIAQIMGHYWEFRGLLEEGSRSLKAVLSLPGQNDDTLAINNLHKAANLAWMRHELETAQAYAAQALDLASRCDNTPAKVSLLNLQGRIYLEEERYEDADLILTEGIQLEDTLHQHVLTPFMTIQRGEAALAQDRLDLAEELLRSGLSSVDPVNQIPYCVGWNNLAEVALGRGSARGAREALKHVLPLALLHPRREVIFMNAITGLLLLERTAEGLEVEVAVRLISYINRACDRSGTTLSPMTQKQMKERLNQTQRQIPSDQWQSLWNEGQRWTSEKAYSVARDVLGDN
jgi:tetratricopeptide (TPR) repeat protein